jgi:dephospho-CoA kinase
MKQLKVAITGNIGSGKSSFAKYLSSKGYTVIDADELSKNILASDKTVKKEVVKEFGSDAYLNEKINKTFLASIVFTDPVKLNLLNSIIHPCVKIQIDSIIKEKHSREKIIFIESALVYEADIEDDFDFVVLIKADFDIRLKRSLESNNFTEKDFIRRDKNQIPENEKEKRADFIFSNNGSKDDLYKKAELLLLTLNAG